MPKEVILDKLKKIESIYPLFYAWFVNEPDSISLRKVAEGIYNECLEQPQFVEEFLKHIVPGAPRTRGGK